MDRSSVESVFHRAIEAVGDPCSDTSLLESFADLCHAPSRSSCFDAQITQDIVMCWITELQNPFEGIGRLFGARRRPA